MSTEVLPELDAQYRALREEAGYLARAGRGILRVSGPDAAEYLQSQLTNEIEALEPGAGCYAALLDRTGHVQADMRLLRLEGGEFLLDLEPEPVSAALGHLRTYSVGREVEVSDASAERAVTSVLGPRAGELAGFEGLGAEHAHRGREWDGVEVLGVATDLGVDLSSAAEDVNAVRETLDRAGAVEVSEEAAEILRVESGRPRFGFEIGAKVMPAEAGIVERAVNFEKGCYIGQETVARLHYKGRPNRILRGLRLSAPAERGAPLTFEGKEVGAIGTSCLSPALGPIALAIVRREAAPGGTVAVGESGTTAEIAELPFAS